MKITFEFDLSNPNDLTQAAILAAKQSGIVLAEIQEGDNDYPYGIGSYGRFAYSGYPDTFIQAGWDIRGNAALEIYGRDRNEADRITIRDLQEAFKILPFKVSTRIYDGPGCLSSRLVRGDE